MEAPSFVCSFYHLYRLKTLCSCIPLGVDVDIDPLELNSTIDGNATYYCSINAEAVVDNATFMFNDTVWNETAHGNKNASFSTDGTNLGLELFHLSSSLNNTRVWCIYEFTSGSNETSKNSLLRIQGLLDTFNNH